MARPRKKPITPFGARLYSAIEASQFKTVSAFSGVSGVGMRQLSRYVSGEVSPRIEQIDTWAELLSVSPLWLLTGQEEMIAGEYVLESPEDVIRYQRAHLVPMAEAIPEFKDDADDYRVLAELTLAVASLDPIVVVSEKLREAMGSGDQEAMRSRALTLISAMRAAATNPPRRVTPIETYGEMLKRIMDEREVTVAELAEKTRTGVQPGSSHITSLLGGRPPPRDLSDRIAHVLGIPPDDLWNLRA